MNGKGHKLTEEAFRTLVHEKLNQQSEDHKDTLNQLKELNKKMDDWTYRVDQDMDNVKLKANNADTKSKIAIGAMGILLTALLAVIVTI